jgi:hypothetical protein
VGVSNVSSEQRTRVQMSPEAQNDIWMHGYDFYQINLYVFNKFHIFYKLQWLLRSLQWKLGRDQKYSLSGNCKRNVNYGTCITYPDLEQCQSRFSLNHAFKYHFVLLDSSGLLFFVLNSHSRRPLSLLTWWKSLNTKIKINQINRWCP